MNEELFGKTVVTCVCEGRIHGVFKGFRNLDTIFKFEGGTSWRQHEYKFEYHHLFSPKAKVFMIKKGHRPEFFLLKVDGVKTMVLVKASYA